VTTLSTAPTVLVYTGINGGNTVAYSTNGINWTGSGRAGQGNQCYGVDFGNNLWVLGGESQTASYSTNAINWTALPSNPVRTVSCILYANKIWVAGGGYNGNSFAYSVDAITWTYCGGLIYANSTVRLAYNNNVFVSVGNNGSNNIAYSVGGITWTGMAYPGLNNTTSSLLYNTNTKTWIVGGNAVAYSTDAVNWTNFPGTNGILGGIKDMDNNGNLLVAGASSGSSLAYSMNGTNWTTFISGIFTGGIFGINYSSTANVWNIGVSGANIFSYSSNGITWTGLGTGPFTNGFAQQIASGQPTVTPPPIVWYSTGGGSYPLSYSTNGTMWTLQNFAGCTAVGSGFNNLSYNGTVAVGTYYNGNIWYSSNFTTWTSTLMSSTTIGIVNNNCSAYGNGVFVFGGNGNCIVYSSNGINWTFIPNRPFTNAVNYLSYHAYLNIFMAVGNGGSNTVAYSSNGVNWTGYTTGQGITLPVAGSSTSNIIVANLNNTLAYTTGGVGTAFTTCPSLPSGFSGSNSITGLSFVNNLFFAGCQNGFTYTLAYSTNGINWTGAVLGTLLNNMGYTYGFNYSPTSGLYVACGQNGNCILYSTNAVNWTTAANSANNINTTFGGTASFAVVADTAQFVPSATVTSVTFQGTTPIATTLSWSGSNYIGVYITSNGTTSPATSPSSPLYVAGALTTSYTFTGMTSGTSYTFYVYPVNAAGIPTSASVVASPGQYNVSGSVTTMTSTPPSSFVTVSTGQGGNTMAYTTNGVNWTSAAFKFGIQGASAAYNPTTGIWVVGGGSGTVMAYSTNAVSWSAITTGALLTGYTWGIAVNPAQNVWCAAVQTPNAMMYSADAYNWSLVPNGGTVLGANGQAMEYSSTQDLWVAGGQRNLLAYSKDGYN